MKLNIKPKERELLVEVIDQWMMNNNVDDRLVRIRNTLRGGMK